LSPARAIALISLAMVAFAGNSLLCRAALKHTAIDAFSFTLLRLLAGAMALLFLARPQRRESENGNWVSAAALFVYAAGFSYAYVSLTAATGTLILFAAVEATMIGYGIWHGERLRKRQVTGLLLALGGLVVLALPGLASPPLYATALMLAAGSAWGIYSLRGRGMSHPIRVTAGNFVRSVPIAILLGAAAWMTEGLSIDINGFWYAVASGALASGGGYAAWYAALPAMKASTAATVQLSVPVIAAIGGILFLGEPLTWRLALVSVAILGGIALAIRGPFRCGDPLNPKE